MSHSPVPQAVLNLLALEGYEARHHDVGSMVWAIYRISDGWLVDTWTFASETIDYVEVVRGVIARHREGAWEYT